MLRAMTVEVTVKTVEPTPTAVVAAATTWAEFPAMWGPMLDQVWSFLRGGAPAGLYQHGHNIMLYKDDAERADHAEISCGVDRPAVPEDSVLVSLVRDEIQGPCAGVDRGDRPVVTQPAPFHPPSGGIDDHLRDAVEFMTVVIPVSRCHFAPQPGRHPAADGQVHGQL
jgi:hypothetical protein